MPAFSWKKNNKGIRFCEVAVGLVQPVACIELNRPFHGVRLKAALHLEWESGHIRLRWIDKVRLKDEYRLSYRDIEMLEKMLCWEYARIVRYCIHGTASPFDYSSVAGNNLRILRQSAGYTLEESSKLLNISQEQLRIYEKGEADVESELSRQKKKSVIYMAALLYGVSVSEILSQGLFYHIPVKNVSIERPDLEVGLKRYNTGKLTGYA